MPIVALNAAQRGGQGRTCRTNSGESGSDHPNDAGPKHPKANQAHIDRERNRQLRQSSAIGADGVAVA
jgi:hypothetical protein